MSELPSLMSGVRLAYAGIDRVGGCRGCVWSTQAPCLSVSWLSVV